MVNPAVQQMFKNQKDGSRLNETNFNQSIRSQSQDIFNDPKLLLNPLKSETVIQKPNKELYELKSHSVDKSDFIDKDVDIKAFSIDLETYYKKIHGEIAQLKTILADVCMRKTADKKILNQPDLQDYVLFASAASNKESLPIPSELKPKLAQVNSSAIVRSQYLIEAIKKEILSSLKQKTGNQAQATQPQKIAQSQNQKIVKNQMSTASITFGNECKSRQQSKLLRFQERFKDLKSKSSTNEAEDQAQSSIKVIQLLEQLEAELLTSFTKAPQKADQIAIKIHLSRSSINQFEEIEGSQERSPHLIRHMEIQRQIPHQNQSENETKIFKDYQRRVQEHKALNNDREDASFQLKMSQEGKQKIKKIDPLSKRQKQRTFKKLSLIGQVSQSVSDSQIFNLSKVAKKQEQKKDTSSNNKSPFQCDKMQSEAQNQVPVQNIGLSNNLINLKVHSANRLCGTPELKKKTLSDSTVNITSTSGAFLIDQSHNISQVMQAVPKTQEKKPALGQIFQRDQFKCLSSSAIRSDSMGFIGEGSFVNLPRQSNLVGASLGSFGNTLEGHKRTSTIKNGQSHSASSLKRSLICSNPKSRISASFGGREFSNNGSNAGANIREGSDHTLTLIFDSDEEPIDENQDIKQSAAQAKSKILSEIVEDYFNESNQMLRDKKSNRKISKKEEVVNQKRRKASIKNKKSEREKSINSSQKKVDLSLGIHSEKLKKVAAQDQEYSIQQSFMNEQSILNLFQDPVTTDQNTSKPKIQRNESSGERISNHQSFLRDSFMKDDMKIDTPYQDSKSAQKIIKSRQNSASSADKIQAKENLVVNQFSSMFKKSNDAPKKSTWEPPPRIQALKSKKKNKVKEEEKGQMLTPSKVETSHLSEIVHVDENSQEFQDEKHNTSKQSMQKYLFQFFLRKGDEK